MKIFVLLVLLIAHLRASPADAGSYVIETIAGTGRAGYSGDEGPAQQAQINMPFGLVRGPDKALYFCDTGNHVIRKIDAQGQIHTVAGSGQAGYTGDGGPALSARLNEPYEVRFDSMSNLFFVEMRNHVVRRVDTRTGRISTIAGLGQPGYAGDDGPATEAQLRQPHSIQFGPEGHLYICDIGNHRIRRLAFDTGLISTFAGTGQAGPAPENASLAGTPLNGPRAIDFDAQGHLWLALREGNALYELVEGQWHRRTGTGQSGFGGNGGPALLATLSGPKGLAVGPDGNVYLADTESHSIRMLNVQSQTLEWLAGTGKPGDGPDGPARQCALARPHGVFVDADGAIYVGDTEAHRIRKLRRVSTRPQ